MEPIGSVGVHEEFLNTMRLGGGAAPWRMVSPLEGFSGDLVQTMTSDGKSAPKPARSGKSARRAAPPAEDPIQRAIGEKLRSVFEAVAQQPVPDRFTELLRRLEEQDRQKK